MAVRMEPNPITNLPEYIIDGWENGIADSAFLGIANMQNVNIKNSPKTAYSNLQRVPASGTPTEQVNYIIQDQGNLNCLYSVTSSGVVRQSIDSGKTWTVVGGTPAGSAHGNGIFIWGKYLHVIRDMDIDAILISNIGTSGAWITMKDNAGGADIFTTTTGIFSIGENSVVLPAT